MTSEAPDLLDNRIAEWRGYLQRSQAIHANDVDELEDHLRNRIDDLRAAGLDDRPWLVGGVIPEQDRQAIQELGFAGIFRRAAEAVGVEPGLLVFGAGLGIPYHDGDAEIDLIYRWVESLGADES